LLVSLGKTQLVALQKLSILFGAGLRIAVLPGSDLLVLTLLLRVFAAMILFAVEVHERRYRITLLVLALTIVGFALLR